jgi:hypothetical protein
LDTGKWIKSFASFVYSMKFCEEDPTRDFTEDLLMGTCEIHAMRSGAYFARAVRFLILNHEDPKALF